ncbi:hypothetical protein P7C73_g4694, partial [Tremellales sp. Uapishka_1]
MPGLNPTQAGETRRGGNLAEQLADIDNFVAVTQASPSEAQHFLASGTTLDGAIEDFFAAQTAETPAADEVMANKPASDTPPSRGSGANTLSGKAADTALPEGWGQPAKNMLGRGAVEDDDSDDEDEKRKGETTYAGGERSGLAIRGPDKPRAAGPKGLVDDILKQASENGPARDEPAPRSAWGGQGNVLGSEDDPPAAVPTVAPVSSSTMDGLLASLLGRRAPAQPEEPLEEVQRSLIFWRNGFSIEDGDLYPYDKPENQELLEAIHNGRAPPSVFGVKFNQPLQLVVSQRTDTDFVPPPKQPAKPFSGGGNRLGSPAPEVAASSSAKPPPGILQGGAVSSAGNKEFQLDDSKPTTSIQVRLGDGTRMVARVNLTHTVRDLRSFVAAARPDVRAFVLQTTFPSRELSDDSETVESAKLQNAVVVQRFV